MKSRSFFLALAALFLFSFDSVAQTTVTRSLSAFDKIAISGGFDKVILREGNTESVSIEAKGIDPDKIKTEVRGSTLEIGIKNGSWSNYKATVTVTYKKIREIASSGSSDIVAESVIKGDEFELATSGSGDFTGTFDVRELEVAISGSSDMNLKGRADEQEIAISGSGDVNASELKGSRAEVAISGSGDVKLHVDGPVKTAVSGSGSVTNNN
jgi:hypothetical protein